MKILCIDTGLFVEQCAALADGGKHELKYFTPWATWAPMYKDYALGKNFNYMQKEFYFWKWIDWADMIVGFDVANQDIIGYLREKYPNKSIVGSGYGCVLEDDRVKLKKLQAAIGLPEQKYEVVYGVEGPKGLREYLKKHTPCYVKLNRFRGELESFPAKDYESIEIDLDKMSYILGPHKDDNDPKTGFPFVCEETIDTEVELGFDGFFNGKEFISPCFCGFEWDKGPYCAKVMEYEDLPEPIFETMEALAPILERFNYRGSFSTEEKIVSLKDHYLLDVCARLPAPLSQIFPMAINNYTEFIYAIGKGEDVRMDIDAEYVGLYPFKSEKARNDYVRVDIKDINKASLIMATANKKGDYYAVKGFEEIGTAMAMGKTRDEVYKKLVENSEAIEASDIDKNGVDTIGDKFEELYKEAEKIGITF